MQVMFGAAALSAFKSSKLLLSLQAKLPQIKAFSAQFVHFLDCTLELSNSDSEVVRELLHYGVGFSSDSTVADPRFAPNSRGSAKARHDFALVQQG